MVLLSDYFGLSFDELVKGVDVQDVRNKNLSEKQLSSIYRDISFAKSTINRVINIFAIIGLAGILWG